MVQVTHCGDNTSKINNILLAAQKRFGHYGLEKTTMREIAADLGMSKASLYYYFPDKESLFIAVVETEQDEFFQMVKEALISLEKPDERLRLFCELRLKHFRTFFNLARLRLSEFRAIKPLLSTSLDQFRLREIQMIEEILNLGNSLGVFKIENTTETATLFIELTKGLRSLLLQNKELMYIEEEEYQTLAVKQSAFTEIFIKGISI